MVRGVDAERGLAPRIYEGGAQCAHWVGGARQPQIFIKK